MQFFKWTPFLVLCHSHTISNLNEVVQEYMCWSLETVNCLQAQREGFDEDEREGQAAMIVIRVSFKGIVIDVPYNPWSVSS